MKSYFITLKNNANKYVSILELKSHMRLAVESLGGDWYSHIGYELDSMNRMHAHTCVCYPNNISCKKKGAEYQKLCNDKSWHIHFRLIDAGDEPVAYNYALKEADPQFKDEMSYQQFIQKRLRHIDLFKTPIALTIAQMQSEFEKVQEIK